MDSGRDTLSLQASLPGGQAGGEQAGGGEGQAGAWLGYHAVHRLLFAPHGRAAEAGTQTGRTPGSGASVHLRGLPHPHTARSPAQGWTGPWQLGLPGHTPGWRRLLRKCPRCSPLFPPPPPGFQALLPDSRPGGNEGRAAVRGPPC